jgi:hypothetical protein
MQIIQHQELASAQASITFSSIPQDGTDLLVLASIRTTRSDPGAWDDIMFRFNGDSTANRYTFRRLLGNGSSASSSSGSLDRGYFGVFSANSFTANTFGNGSLYIPNYSGSANKSSSGDTVAENNATLSPQILLANLYSNTAAITSIVFFSEGAHNLMAGSSITLYKITKGSDGIVTVS